MYFLRGSLPWQGLKVSALWPFSFLPVSLPPFLPLSLPSSLPPSFPPSLPPFFVILISLPLPSCVTHVRLYTFTLSYAHTRMHTHTHTHTHTQADTLKERYQKIGDTKRSTPIEVLCENFPGWFLFGFILMVLLYPISSNCFRYSPTFFMLPLFPPSHFSVPLISPPFSFLPPSHFSPHLISPSLSFLPPFRFSYPLIFPALSPLPSPYRGDGIVSPICPEVRLLRDTRLQLLEKTLPRPHGEKRLPGWRRLWLDRERAGKW